MAGLRVPLLGGEGHLQRQPHVLVAQVSIPAHQILCTRSLLNGSDWDTVDTGNTGRVLASDAAAFLKKSGLPDLILGKIWDLADTDGKGILNKQVRFRDSYEKTRDLVHENSCTGGGFPQPSQPPLTVREPSGAGGNPVIKGR
ncbi:Epidermal growth factor receptor substrate 15 [Myotis davidii]|uniref:Epidermal growth factor receptor substrate 15 n=1 Tax=Myotis davidii TaxID=225400 RepID=L5LMI6_MYODS|nr:Epidermal growth factor receptor substrate 15 [Myotis davidii]